MITCRCCQPPVCHLPPLEDFLLHFMMAPGGGQPAIITGVCVCVCVHICVFVLFSLSAWVNALLSFLIALFETMTLNCAY